MIIHTSSRRMQAKAQVHRVVRSVRSQQDGSAYLKRMLICEFNGFNIMQAKARGFLLLCEFMKSLCEWFDEIKHLIARLIFVESICDPHRDATGQGVCP